ncbi:disulfide bond formation protein B [Pseudorhodobacter wandonensis]|jgi:disulfide bond formation protein DsbB|uniref:disulfide bond formation protein B n=1 Tax=Pseudorhodobacter wandonensis TaxID=1120568 RepID=UPI00067E2B84|nr:disulfide bond formation protein B [Pseudorhodobacter wandonensis]
MTRTQFILLAIGGSAAALAGAYGFEYIGGLQPCQMCWWQRYAHMAAIVIGLLALVLKGRTLPYLGALAALTGSAIALYHTGVERAWWQGITSCSTGSIAGLDVTQLLDPAANVVAPVRCDAIAWEMFGLSMASWNGILSLGLVIFWLMAARKRA